MKFVMITVRAHNEKMKLIQLPSESVECKQNAIEQKFPLFNYRSANGDDFSLEEVEGSHHVHLNNPNAVMKPIQRFLDKHPKGRKDNSSL